MSKHTLFLVTYERGNYPTGKTKPYHWSYFIQIKIEGGANEGIAHQLRGVPGAFYYNGPEKVDLAKSGSLKEELEIGEVDSSKLDRVHEILKNVPINKVEHLPWNCQDWALEGFETLKKEGFTYDHLTGEALTNWLKER